MMRRTVLAALGAALSLVSPAPALNPNHQCSFCHSAHFAAGSFLLNNAVVETLCLTCHGPGGTAATKADVHSNRTGSVYPAFRATCTDCHSPHSNLTDWLGGANLKLVGGDQDGTRIARILSPNNGIREVAFESRGTGVTSPTLHSFADNDQDRNGYYDGVCETCHTLTQHHRNTAAGDHTHNTGSTCTACHPHNAGFAPTAGSCTDCHSVPQDNGDGRPPGGRRAIVGEFSLASHHLQGATINLADCVVCHDMTQHQQGRVRLKNADSPNNPATVVVLDGNPATSATQAVRLEAFCLACHDSNGAAGSAPFSDGRMPPVISTSWTASSHASRLTCFGDGQTFGCHASGHGSRKRKIQAPAAANQPPISGDPLRQEEGMCYSCHGGSGPASSNVQAQFQLTSHHRVSSLEQTTGAKVECDNCHNPHIATAAVRLANPDTAAATPWTGTGVAFCQTCHDGVPPTGVTFPATSPGTGWNKATYAGRHAASLGANSCRQCHDRHGTAFPAILYAQYLTADNNPYQVGETDYDLCWRCHNATAIVAGTNAFSDLHNKHVVDQRAPCILCHDTHRPADLTEPGLINFSYAASKGIITFPTGRNVSTAFIIDTVANRGSCYLRCHGQSHSPLSYSRAGKLP